MEFTPNRGDCLSVYGLVRDLNVFYRTNLELPIYLKDIPTLDLNFINEAEDACPQLSFLNIEIDGKISKYKDYLENYFKDLNLNKNNFFTDISNYVAYEMGQPTHSYDFLNIGGDITLKLNCKKTKFTTLHNNTIDLNGSDLVFTSDNKIINLSGVIGGLESACSKTTTNALIECAYFHPESIIGKSVKYNINSEASHKFERGVDPECHSKVLKRFIHIVSEHCKIVKVELFKFKGSKSKKTELNFDLKKINDILGSNVTEHQYKNSLTKLGFDIDDGVINVPSYRSDIQHQNDLAEELARVMGYDNIPISCFNIKNVPDASNILNESKIRAFFVDNNFIEVINSSFCSENIKNSLKVDNPLDTTRGYIRTDIVDSLTENVIYNEKRQKDSIKFFEISDVYSYKDKLYSEKKLGVIVSGRRGQNYKDFSKKLDKNYLNELFNKIDIDVADQILNIDRKNLNSKIKTPIYAIELNLEEVLLKIDDYNPINKAPDKYIKYKQISEFPLSKRDFSFLIRDKLIYSKFLETLNSISDSNLKNLAIFDFYAKKNSNELKIGIRMTFQSHEKTLSDNDIEYMSSKLLKPLLSIDGVSIPGIVH